MEEQILYLSQNAKIKFLIELCIMRFPEMGNHSFSDRPLRSSMRLYTVISTVRKNSAIAA